MCFGGTSSPKPPGLPPPPPEPPQILDAAVVKARQQQIKSMRQAAGWKSTNLTNGKGANFMGTPSKQLVPMPVVSNKTMGGLNG